MIRVGGDVSAVAVKVTKTSSLMLAITVFCPAAVPSRSVAMASPD